MTEDCDAAVVVVSEEDGTISFARGGELQREIEPNQLMSALRNLPT